MKALSMGNADVIEFDVLEESTQLALAVENGDIDMAMYIDSSLVDEVGNTDGIELAEMTAAEERGIMFNMMEDSVFYDNLPLRQAMLLIMRLLQRPADMDMELHPLLHVDRMD